MEGGMEGDGETGRMNWICKFENQMCGRFN